MKVMEKALYRNLNSFLRGLFGEKVYKVGLYGGFTCPNRDGTVGTDGCTFCNPASSRPRCYSPGMTIGEQLETGCRYIGKRYGANLYMAYFQDYTTTWGDPDRLREIYRSALAHPGVVGLALCTRPDCLGDPVLDLLEEIKEETFLWVEVGVQTSSDRLLRAMNRCHTMKDTEEAFRRLNSRAIYSSAHVILGYPGETETDRLETARFVSGSGALGVKIQNLHVVRNTGLAHACALGMFEPISFDGYVDAVIRFLENTSPGVVVQRLTGEAPGELTISPGWSVNKMAVLNRIRSRMNCEMRWQGKALGYPVTALEEPLSLPE
jgi:radical SAM protein (TIGR01212 family)